MATVQDLVASTDLPEGSKPRLKDVMQQIGYAQASAVDSVVSKLTMDDLETAANTAGLDPPLTIWEKRALLAQFKPSGQRAMADRRAIWNAPLLAIEATCEVCRCCGLPAQSDCLQWSASARTCSYWAAGRGGGHYGNQVLGSA